jgi:hypothetical protein
MIDMGEDDNAFKAHQNTFKKFQNNNIPLFSDNASDNPDGAITLNRLLSEKSQLLAILLSSVAAHADKQANGINAIQQAFLNPTLDF